MDDRRVELQAEIDGHRADLFALALIIGRDGPPGWTAPKQ